MSDLEQEPELGADIQTWLVTDPEMITALEAIQKMTPEQREAFDRQRAEWRDAGGRDL